MFSWRSYDDILFLVLPFIENVIAVEQDIIDTSTNATAVAESRTKIVQLEEARKGWQSVLDRDDKLYEDAKAGKLTRVTQLVANALLQDGKGNDNVKFINGTNAPNADALRTISAIRYSINNWFYRNDFHSSFFCSCCSFGGYGAEIAYSESLSTDKSHSDSWNVDITFGIGFKADISFKIFGIGSKLSLLIGLSGGVNVGGSTDTSTSVSRSRGFTLSDSDEYDVFDVEVCSVLETFFLV